MQPTTQQILNKLSVGLNIGQQNCLQLFAKFQDQRKENVFILEGIAGSGKSFITDRILSLIFTTQPFVQIVMTATTNPAVGELRKKLVKHSSKANVDFKTIQSLEGIRAVKVDDKIEFKKVGTPTHREYDYIFVDEYSMISKVLSGYLKHEIASHRSVKVVFIGDTAQLKPVGDEGITPVHSWKTSFRCFLDVSERQRSGCAIGEFSTQVRNGGRYGYQSEFARQFQTTDEGRTTGLLSIKITHHSELFEKLLRNCFTDSRYEKDPLFCRYVAFTNIKVNEINKLVRENILYENVPELPDVMDQEIILVDTPVFDEYGQSILFANDMIRLHDIISHDVVFNFSIGDMNCMVEGYKATAEVLEDGRELKINLISKSHEGRLERFLKKVSSRGYRLKGFERKAWFEKYHKIKNTFLYYKYPYSTTIHKCQGITVERCFVDAHNILGVSQDEDTQRRLMYVASTRPSDQLYLYY